MKEGRLTCGGPSCLSLLADLCAGELRPKRRKEGMKERRKEGK
jgi:hypothetical protein